MRIEAEAIAHAPVEDVWSWWTDFGRAGETIEVGHGIGKSQRRIVEAGERRVVFDERAPLPMGRSFRMARRTVEIHPEDRRLEEKAVAPLGYDETWRFEPTSGGEWTRIRRVMEVRSKAADLTAKVTAPMAKALAERDLKHHVREFETERLSGGVSL